MVGTKKEDNLDNAIQLEVFIFWLKISFGIIGGILHYIIQRILFREVLFYMQGLLRGFIIVLIIFGYLFIIHIIFYLLIRLSKAYFTKVNPIKFSNWRLTLKSSGAFFAVFLISASLSFYVGF